ncbi:uncharacterized protein LOC144468739 [Augochlora pura]
MTTNMTSQEQLMKATVQSQLARIKKEVGLSFPSKLAQKHTCASCLMDVIYLKEEEEELWISGEELYTEGSSDEEECTTQSTMRRKTNSNQSSHVSSTDGHSTETKAKTCSTSVSKSNNNTEGQTQKVPKTQTKTQATDTPADWDEIDDTKISWKTKRDIDDTMVALKELWSLKELTELDSRSLESCFSKESYDNDNENDINHSDRRTQATEECIEEKILEMKNFDDLIERMNFRVKKAKEDTLFCQCENRKRLKNILSATSPSENGKLAENTQLFLQLCPTYITLSAEKKNMQELYLKCEKHDPITATTESHTDNVLNISLGANDFKLQACRNRDTMNVSSPHNLSNRLDLELLNNAGNEKWETMNTTSNTEEAIVDALDFDINPYVIDEKTKNLLLELEKKLSVYYKNFCNDRGRLARLHNGISKTSTVVSTIDSVSTMKSLPDVDKDFLDKVIEEVRII